MMSTTAIIFLLLFFTFTESKLSDKNLDKSNATTVSSDNKMLVWECFADFLVHQFVNLPTIGIHFTPETLVVNREQLRKFLLENEEKTAELWNCFKNANAFAKIIEEESGESKKTGEQARDNSIYTTLTNLMDTYNIEIARHLLEKLHNAQCLLDLGVIEGKILMEKPCVWADYKPMEESKWFKELKETGKKHQIAIGKEGADHMRKCLRKGKPFEVKIAIGKKRNKQRLLLLGSVDRKELVKIISSKQVPFSKWLLEKIDLKLTQCLANLFVSHFGVQTDMHVEKFAIRGDNFPEEDSIDDLNAKEKQPFLDCLTSGVSPFNKFFADREQVDNLVKAFYEVDTEQIVPSQVIQWKLHNAQCWLDLGAIEGQIKTETENLIKNYPHGETVPWLEKLKSNTMIVISPEGAAHLQGCLHKGKPFEATMKEKTAGKKQQWHLQLLNVSERGELLKTIKIIPFSERLYKEYIKEQDCLTDFLVRQQFAQTTLNGIHWRMIVWGNERKWPAKFHADNSPEKFEKLRSCIFRRSTLLKMDTNGQQYIDLEPLFKLMDGHIYIRDELRRQINKQSDCFAKFLAFKSVEGSKCLLKKWKGPAGEPLGFYGVNRSYIINAGDAEEAYYALSAENCHLPERVTGVYSEGSDEFKQLWECGVRITTTEEGGKKSIDVRKLLKIHTLEQFYLPSKETFPTTETVAEGRQDAECAICMENYMKDDSKWILPCKHHFHRDCILKWVEHNTCPICRGPFIIS